MCDKVDKKYICSHLDDLIKNYYQAPWESCQIYKIAGCACAGNAGNVFFPPQRVSVPNMHHGTCVTYVPWCMPGSLTSDFVWSRWRGKRSRHTRCMRNPQFYVSGMRPILHTCRTMDMLWEKFRWILPFYMKPISFQSNGSVVCSATTAIFIHFCLKKLNVFPTYW